jgi:hypothetical protein
VAKDRSLVRASDIAAWAFCSRAWWLAHVQQAEHESPQVLEWGNRAHTAHGRQVARARRLQRAGLILAMFGLVLATLTVAIQLWPV